MKFEKALFFLYQNLPSKLRYAIAGSRFTKGLRDKMLRTKDGFKSTTVTIDRSYNQHRVTFEFNASIAVAAKAVKKGVENALLRQSLKVLEQRLGNKAKDAIILDVGSNFGFLSLVWACFLKDGKGKVHAFEPEAQLAQCIHQSVESNGLQEKLSIHPFALGAEKGTINLYTFPGGASGNPDQGFSEVIEVPVLSIDLFMNEQGLERLDLIKIDVDSIEYDILKGAEESIRTHRPAIITETNQNPVILSLLKEWHYKLYDIHGIPLKEGQLPHDVLALPV